MHVCAHPAFTAGVRQRIDVTDVVERIHRRALPICPRPEQGLVADEARMAKGRTYLLPEANERGRIQLVPAPVVTVLEAAREVADQRREDVEIFALSERHKIL